MLTKYQRRQNYMILINSPYTSEFSWQESTKSSFKLTAFPFFNQIQETKTLE